MAEQGILVHHSSSYYKVENFEHTLENSLEQIPHFIFFFFFFTLLLFPSKEQNMEQENSNSHDKRNIFLNPTQITFARNDFLQITLGKNRKH